EGLLDGGKGQGRWVKSGQVVDAAAVLGAARRAGVVCLEAGGEGGGRPVAVVGRLAGAWGGRVEDGSRAPGTHLPTQSRLAEYLGTSNRPVQMAYEKLVEEGLLDSGIGVGTWVKSGQVVDPAAVSGASRGAGVVFPEAGRLEGEGPVPAVAL